jgi:hypothetical protein
MLWQQTQPEPVQAMAEIVNLRRARKARARDIKAKEADANRATHGIAKPARDLAKAEKEKAQKDADAHKLDRED